jgi:cell division protein FtsB
VAKSFRFLLGGAVVFFLVLLATSWVASFRDLRRAHAREALLLERIRTTEIRNQELELKIERLRDDPLMLERLAREQLGLVREGEIVVVFPEETD